MDDEEGATNPGVDPKMDFQTSGGGLKRKLLRDSNEKNESKKPTEMFEPDFYDESNHCKMEYFILADLQLEENEANKNKRINDVQLGKILQSLNLNQGVLRINRIGFRRSKILFATAKQANAVLKSEELKKHNLKTFVPISFVHKFGVIRDVPKSLSEEEILSNIISEIPIKSVTRFTRRDPR